jgi:hypothetical protein
MSRKRRERLSRTHFLKPYLMISGRNYSRTSWKRLIPKADTTEGEKKQETATAQKIMHVYFSLSTHGVTLGSSRAPSQGQSAET